MMIETWLAFVAASVLLLIVPGPTTLTVISYSMSHGRRANGPLIAAVALGDSTALFASVVGLGALLATSAFWFLVVKIVGGLYLLWLGIGLLRAGVSSADFPHTTAPDSRWRLFLRTYLVTALNPKGIIFFVAFLPQFIVPDASVSANQQLLMLAATFVCLTTLNAVLYVLFAGSAHQMLSSIRARRNFNIGSGVLLSLAGLWALLARRVS